MQFINFVLVFQIRLINSFINYLILTPPLIRCSEEDPMTERMKLFSVPSSKPKTAVTDALQI